MRRVRAADWIAAAAGVALLGSMFADWYARVDVGVNAWQAFSVLDIALALLASAPLALVVLQATRDSPALPVAFSVFTTVAGAVALLLILYRIVDQPGPNDAVDVEPGAWVGLVAAVVVTAGGWRSMRDEAMPGVALPPVEDLPAPTP
jgi:drug/metabolite transporter (DMT)-like permease